jgi:hypothetical protein
MAGYVINWPHGPESIIQDYGSADPDPKEIITDPRHCQKLVVNVLVSVSVTPQWPSFRSDRICRS